jgi:hypothetical protein
MMATLMRHDPPDEIIFLKLKMAFITLSLPDTGT